MLLGLHAQSGDTGGLAVRVHVEIVGVDACRHAGRPSKQAAHVSLSHVTPGTWHAQKIGDPAGRVGVRCHTGSHSVAGHNTARHRRRCAAATNPRRVLNLKYKRESNNVKEWPNCGEIYSSTTIFQWLRREVTIIHNRWRKKTRGRCNLQNKKKIQNLSYFSRRKKQGRHHKITVLTLMQQWCFLWAALTVVSCRLRGFNMNYATGSNITTTGLGRKKRGNIRTHFHYHETEKKARMHFLIRREAVWS